MSERSTQPKGYKRLKTPISWKTAPKQRQKDRNILSGHPLALQHSFGNQAVRALLDSGALQTKLTVSKPGDPYEREADRVADAVMRMPDVQRQVEPEEEEETPIQQKAIGESITPLQRQSVPDEEEEDLQAKGDATAQNTSGIEPQLRTLQGGGEPLSQEIRNFFEPRFERDFSAVRVHHDANAAELSRAVNARAFTLGNTITFGAGQYRPESSEGKRLLGHELVHTLQQNGGGTLRRQPANPVTMPPTTVRTGMPSDLSSLSTPAAPGSVTATRSTADVERNSQLPGTPLPFTNGGWDGADIANKLGQFDRIPGTDSDAVRCVQAVALISHILNGPAATVNYLSSISLQGMLSAGRFDTRTRTALRVIEYVREQIRNRRATYGEMYWAMEAAHDLFYSDTSGTSAETGEIRSQVVPILDLAQNMVNMDVWCSTPAELMTQAATLNPGEQFMLNTWSVSFNHYFDIAGASPTQRHLTYTQTDENDRPQRTVRIHRIDTSRGKPAHTQINTDRDHRSGHQMLIYKDATDGHIKMYEPENTTSGRHLYDLTNDRTVLASLLFNDQPSFEIFNYVQLLGKVVPSPATSAFAP